MGLSSALNTALIGLGFNQRQLDVAATNIANADTVGYTRKSVSASVTYDGNGIVTGVDTDSMRRYLDEAVQGQYRTSLAESNYAGVAEQYTARLDTLFGTIQDPGSLAATVNAFTSSVSNLVAGPEAYTNRLEMVRAAGELAAKLNSMSDDIQGMRQEVEYQIADQVDRVNDLLGNIKDIDRQIIAASQDGDKPVGLMDQRDMLLEELSGFIDIEVKPTEQGGVRVHTSGGTPLYDVDTMRLTFDARGNVSATSLYDVDPSQRRVGTLTLENSEGSKIDLLATKTLRSGSLAGLVAMRDGALADAQTQLDELAAGVARAFSTHVEPGTAYPASGTQTGYELDLANLQPGDSLSFDYKDLGTGRTKSVTLYRSDGPEPPALTATNDPDSIFLAVDFSSGNYATIAGNIQAALDGDARIGAGTFAVANPGGSTLRLESTAPASVRIENAVTNETASGPSVHADAFALFVDDGGQPFTGLADGRPSTPGFAARINVSSTFQTDPSLLVEYASGIASGDATRPQAVLDKLTLTKAAFSPGTRIGGASSVFEGSINDFVTAAVSHQSGRYAQAKATATGQEVVTSNLKSRLDASSKVSVDEELAQLVQLQNAYAANARVMQVVRELYDILIRS
ncbi:flagellar hook-associated protein FlgK [Stappia sp.]|uniref:flagellar hook-associated protein FlgK n=1 Tax=Stappia sp. TaxID=1870903 RepID=UPI0032D8C987